MPVYAQQYGRLGNNLFQKAAAIGYAIKNGMEYNLRPPFRHGNTIMLREGAHSFNKLPFEESWRKKDVILNGYWQSEKYFAHCRGEVLKAFDYSWELNHGWCSIHVRRGDYLKYPDKHPVVTMEYLKQAMFKIYWERDIRQFMVFSDDIDWCQENFIQKDLPYDFLFSVGRTETEDLAKGSCCEHNIISNSTFSWWGAWLNQNPDKLVISPSKDNWFGAGNAHLCTDDIIPESWIQIKY